MADGFTPQTAAIKLSHWLDALVAAGVDRFPINVEQLALSVGPQLKWKEPIFKVQAAPIKNFEGGLFRIDSKGWALLYNDKISSDGRIRFTQAHELGHYMLHRDRQQQFECSSQDVLEDDEERKIESEAHDFAASLLMPLNHFRKHVPDSIDLDALSGASAHFGVSLTAAALRWIKSTQESAVLVLSREGYILWSVSSDHARAKSGAYIKTKGRVIEVPAGSLAADANKPSSRTGENIALKVWFPHAHPDATAREMKIRCDNYYYTLTLLHLSKGDKVWKPFEAED